MRVEIKSSNSPEITYALKFDFSFGLCSNCLGGFVFSSVKDFFVVP